ncbi:DUF882 domain-containing protein [Vibrio sp. SM6]|uniref:Murein endopeptidase K n=1 Tax=Vibrio agarilyticus TaxID=2726741 RepID=A0A7X8TSM4_9VIBR|nr:DUF882 domain-containing protein [Vibrio agarilyticus]NLS14044.1 DUF882 domain-containing protein [Vibrio agarilyticus]
MPLDLSRRRFLQFAGAGVALAALPTWAGTSSDALKGVSRTLLLGNIHTGEKLETCYFDGSNYVQKELDRLNHHCRDFRRNETYAMDKRLFDQLVEIQNRLDSKGRIMIISGYRSPATNNALRANSSGVAKKSFHMTGQAIDFRIEGVKLAKVREAALSLKAGGVGYYPSSDFVHIDTGHVRSWS